MKGAHRSRCPINLTLEMLGDRWSLIVIRDIMFGNRRHYRPLSPSFNLASYHSKNYRSKNYRGEKQRVKIGA